MLPAVELSLQGAGVCGTGAFGLMLFEKAEEGSFFGGNVHVFGECFRFGLVGGLAVGVGGGETGFFVEGLSSREEVFGQLVAIDFDGVGLGSQVLFGQRFRLLVDGSGGVFFKEGWVFV